MSSDGAQEQAGQGMLRDKLVDVAWEVHQPWVHIPEGQSMYAVVDAIMASIADAGFVVMKAEMLADLVRGIIATHDCHNCAEEKAGVLFDYAELGEMLAGLDRG